MSSTQFTGVITAMVTPFANGKLAIEDLKSFTEFQIQNGIGGLAAAGTTGETSTLNHEENIEVIRCVVETSAGRVPVLAGTGSNSTSEAVELTRLAHEAGAHGMLVVAPYYNKPSQEGLFQHFAKIAEATDKPIVLYSIPSRCGVEIGVDTVERLRNRYPNVNHIKEAGGSCERINLLVRALGDDIVILSGDDNLTLPFMSLGAKGVISVASNLVVADLVEMVRAALANDFATATRLHHLYYPLFKDLFIESNPVPLKAAMHRAGLLSSEEVRLPLCGLTSENRKILFQTLDSLSLPTAF